MKSRSYYIAVICLGLSALAFSIYLIPNAKEESLMYFHAKRYDEAKAKFEQLYNSGDRSLSVTMPMIWLQLHYADEDKAIEILENYIAQNPQDKAALEYLGTLYLDANRPYDYLINLESLYTLDPKGEILRKQEQLYSQFGQVEERIKVLQDLVEKKQATILEYRDLSYLLASQGKMQQANLVADKLLRDISIREYDPETVNFLIGLFADLGEKKKAEIVALKYVETHRDITSTIKVISFLARKRMFDQALSVLGSLSPEEQNLPILQSVRTSLYIQSGNRQYAYRILDAEWKKGTLWKRLYPEYISLAAEFESSRARFMQILDSVQIKDLTPEALIMVARRAILTRDPALSDKLSKGIQIKDIKVDPVLAFVIGLGMKPPGKEDEMIFRELYVQGGFNDHQKAIIAQLLNIKGYEKFSKDVLSEIASFHDIPEGDWYDLSSLYVRLGLSKKGLQLIEAVRDNSQETENDDNSWMILAVSAGKINEVISYIKKDESKDANVIRDIFYIAAEQKQYDYLLEIAQELQKEAPGSESLELLAAAELISGDRDRGIKLFQELRQSGQDVSDLFIFALNVAAQRDPSMKEALVREVQELLTQKDLSPTKLREYGFILAEHGHKHEAEEIFFKLSEDKPYSDPDVQMLLSLWGDKINDEQLDWIREQAHVAEGKDRAGWLKELVWRGHPEDMIELATLKDLSEDDLADAYLEAANLLKRKDLVRQAVIYLSNDENRPERLVKVGWEAHYADMDELAGKVMDKAFGISPLNPEVLRGLGVVSYFLGDLKRAKCLLSRYIDDYVADYLAYYTYGEILWTREEKRQSKSYYENAIEKLDAMENRGSPYKAVRATSLFRLGRHEESFKIFDELIREHPNLPNLYADYAQLHMDLRNFKDARRILLRYAPPSTAEGRENEDPVARKFYYLAWVRYYKETNQIKKGIDLLCCLGSEYRNDPHIAAFSADLTFITGNWREAGWYINDALWRRPYNESYWESQFDILSSYYPHMGTSFEYRKTGTDQLERFITVYGVYDIDPYTRFGVLGELDHIHVDPFTRAGDGRNIDFRGSRERAALWLERHLWWGQDIRGSLFLGGGGIYGFGFEYNRMWYIDKLIVGMAYHEPYWGFSQTTIEYGSRDTAYVGWYRRFTNLVEGQLIPRINRYNLKSFSNCLGTWALNGFLSYRIPRTNPIYDWMGKDSQINLVYQLDAETKTHSLKRTDIEGVEFEPIPFDNREQHTFYFFATKRWSPCMALEAFGGYVVDRKALIKRFTPVGGASVEFLERDGLNMKFEYRHTTDNQTTTQTVNSFKMDLRYYY